MKFQAALLVVKNMERSVKFYKEVLGLRVTMDLGAKDAATARKGFVWGGIIMLPVGVLAAMLLNFILKKINSMIF